MYTFLVAIRATGPWAYLSIAAWFFVLSFPLPLGGAYSFFTIGAGFMFGFQLGFIVVFGGATFGLIACLHLGRKYFPGLLSKVVSRSTKARIIQRTIEAHGMKSVILFRLIPIPHGIENGFLTCSDVPFNTILYGSIIGCFPEQITLVYIGSKLITIHDAITYSQNEDPLQTFVLPIMQMSIAVCIITYLIASAKTKMDQMADEIAVEIENKEGDIEAANAPLLGEAR